LPRSSRGLWDQKSVREPREKKEDSNRKILAGGDIIKHFLLSIKESRFVELQIGLMGWTEIFIS
jgi:hypothetical protein